jgi:hypothetical protein
LAGNLKIPMLINALEDAVCGSNSWHTDCYYYTQ